MAGGRGFLIQQIILQISLYNENLFDSKMVPKRADVNVSPKICNMIFRKWGAVWYFSENSSVLVALGFPYFCWYQEITHFTTL